MKSKPNEAERRTIALAFPTEVTTACGVLATIETIDAGDETRFFAGFIWPVNQPRFAAVWRRNGEIVGASDRFDFDPLSSEMRDLVAAATAG